MRTTKSIMAVAGMVFLIGLLLVPKARAWVECTEMTYDPGPYRFSCINPTGTTPWATYDHSKGLLTKSTGSTLSARAVYSASDNAWTFTFNTYVVRRFSYNTVLKVYSMSNFSSIPTDIIRLSPEMLSKMMSKITSIYRGCNEAWSTCLLDRWSDLVGIQGVYREAAYRCVRTNKTVETAGTADACGDFYLCPSNYTGPGEVIAFLRYPTRVEVGRDLTYPLMCESTGILRLDHQHCLDTPPAIGPVVFTLSYLPGNDTACDCNHRRGEPLGDVYCSPSPLPDRCGTGDFYLEPGQQELRPMSTITREGGFYCVRSIVYIESTGKCSITMNEGNCPSG